MSTASNPPAASAPAPAAAANPAATTYTEAEFNAAVERARTEERTKITAELDTARAEVKTLTDKLATQGTELTTLKNTAETLQKAVKTDGNIDVSKLIEEVSERVAKSASNASATKVTELETRVTTLTQELKKKELSEFRTKAIAAAGGTEALIPELVQGNTEEEINASVTRSKNIFDQTKAKIASTTAPLPVAGTDPTKPAAVAAPAAAAPVAAAAAPALAAGQVPPAPEPSPENNPTGIRPVNTSRVAPAQWKDQRAEAMRKLEGRYAAAGSA